MNAILNTTDFPHEARKKVPFRGFRGDQGLPIQELSANFEAADGVAANAYQYNNKELNEDFGLQWMDYGARWYNPQINRWGQVDPLAEKYYAWNGYNYVLGNPVRLVDPDGASPIAFVFRSFHTATQFGFPFTAVGDNRASSANHSATARIHHWVGFETSNNSVTGVYTFSSSSLQLNYPFWPFSYTRRGTETPYSETWSTGNGFSFNYSGQEPIMKELPLIGKTLTPAIDMGGNLNVSETTLPCIGCAEGENGLIQVSITGQIQGDHFPDAEAFIMDPTGQTIMLGQSAHLTLGGPALNLPGNKNAPMMSINAQIIVDQNGKFINAYTTDPDGNRINLNINIPQKGYQNYLNEINICNQK